MAPINKAKKTVVKVNASKKITKNKPPIKKVIRKPAAKKKSAKNLVVKAIKKKKLPLNKKKVVLPSDAKMPKENMSENFKTFLHESAFYILEVSVRDTREKIIDQAENKSLLMDHEICNRAQSALNTSKLRVSEELNWLPGLAPNKAKKYLEDLSQGVNPVDENLNLNSLVKANLLAAFVQTLDDSVKDVDIIPLIINLSEAVDSIEVSDITKEINADRSLAGYSQINDLEQIENEVRDKKIFFAGLIKNFLNELSSKKLVSVVTRIVSKSTCNGSKRAPFLIHEMVSRYEDETLQVLIKQIQDINDLINEIKTDAKSGEKAITPLYDELEELVEAWDVIAQPIQLSTKALGTDHRMSIDLAANIRSLSIDLFNDHHMVNICKRINDLLMDIFKEVPQIYDKAHEDSATIETILSDREKSKEKQKEFDQEITYQTDVGLIFKDKLKISPKGVDYKSQHLDLAEIYSIRWGGVSGNYGTTYTIAMCDEKGYEIRIETSEFTQYSAFTDCLWKAVGVRILTEYLEVLKGGKKLEIGGYKFDDFGIYLKVEKLFGSGESIYTKWDDVSYGSHAGSLNITSTKNNKLKASIDFMTAWDVHILEAMIRISFKSWKGKLSGLLGT
jgi:hypothetical protein